MRHELITLLKSATPFVGETGRAMIRFATHLNDLLSSTAAKETMQVFSTLNPPQTLTVSSDADVQSLEDANPFGLFLILILLIMATGFYSKKKIDFHESKDDGFKEI